MQIELPDNHDPAERAIEQTGCGFGATGSEPVHWLPQWTRLTFGVNDS